MQIQIQILEKYIWKCLKSWNFWEVQIQIQILDKYIWNCLKSWNFWECKYKYNYSTNTSGTAWKVVTSEKCIMRCRLRCLAASATFWSLHSAPNDTFLLCKQDFESKDKYIHILLKHVPYFHTDFSSLNDRYVNCSNCRSNKKKHKLWQ